MKRYTISVDGEDIEFFAVPSSSLWPAGDPCPSDGETTVFQARLMDEMWERFANEKGGQ